MSQAWVLVLPLPTEITQAGSDTAIRLNDGTSLATLTAGRSSLSL